MSASRKPRKPPAEPKTERPRGVPKPSAPKKLAATNSSRMSEIERVPSLPVHKPAQPVERAALAAVEPAGASAAQASPTRRAARPVEVASAAPDAASVSATLDRLDSSWRAFRQLVTRFPLQRIDEPLDRGWTRKQMLAHVAAWHDKTTDRLLGFTKTGATQPIADETDTFNARVARAAIGRTSGEVVGALDASFSRLRRQVALLTDEQLRIDDGWAVSVIASNTYGHYPEHEADLEL